MRAASVGAVLVAVLVGSAGGQEAKAPELSGLYVGNLYNAFRVNQAEAQVDHGKKTLRVYGCIVGKMTKGLLGSYTLAVHVPEDLDPGNPADRRGVYCTFKKADDLVGVRTMEQSGKDQASVLTLDCKVASFASGQLYLRDCKIVRMEPLPDWTKRLEALAKKAREERAKRK